MSTSRQYSNARSSSKPVNARKARSKTTNRPTRDSDAITTFCRTRCRSLKRFTATSQRRCRHPERATAVDYVCYVQVWKWLCYRMALVVSFANRCFESLAAKGGHHLFMRWLQYQYLLDVVHTVPIYFTLEFELVVVHLSIEDGCLRQSALDSDEFRLRILSLWVCSIHGKHWIILHRYSGMSWDTPRESEYHRGNPWCGSSSYFAFSKNIIYAHGLCQIRQAILEFKLVWMYTPIK